MDLFYVADGTSHASAQEWGTGYLPTSKLKLAHILVGLLDHSWLYAR